MMSQVGPQDGPDEPTPGGTDNGHSKSKTKFKVHRPQWNPKSRVTVDTLDMTYIKSMSGVLKIVEVVLCLITLICTLNSVPTGHSIWTDFVLWTCGMISTIIFLSYTLFPHLNANRQPATQKGLHIMELIFCVSAALLLFISFCVMAALAAATSRIIASGMVAAASLACIFCFILALVYLLDAFFSHQSIQSYSKTEGTGSAYQGPLPQPQVLERSRDV